MSSTAQAATKSKDQHKRIKSILISQPKPERSAYFDLAKKWDLQIDWRPFIHVEAVTEKEFRKNRVRPDEFSAVIFTSRNSIEHFFRMCKEMRIQMSAETKYFCLSKAIADYLQKFIVYRKRKVFVGERKINDMSAAFLKHKDKEKFLLPCSNLGAKDVVKFLDEKEFDYQEAMMFRTVASDLSDLTQVTYDVLVFFSPLGIESLYANFPGFEQNDTRMAIFGNTTLKEVEKRGLEANIKAPAPGLPSMTSALEAYLKLSNK